MAKIPSILVLVSMVLPVLAQPVITQQPTNQYVVAGGNAVFTVGVSGTGPFTYQWQFNGTNLPQTNGLIMRVAGQSGSTGFNGDGGLAVNATLNGPDGVAFDNAGDLLVADNGNSRVRMVNTNGYINTIAGGGSGGDGEAATNASINPLGIATDLAGNFYISDASHNEIRKVDANGTITAFAGTGSPGFSGDGGLATAAKIYAPRSVALDRFGNVCLSDSFVNFRIREVTTNGIIETIAGTNTSGFSGDDGPATNALISNLALGLNVDGLGSLYFADSRNHRIRKIDTNGIITTVAGNGTAGFGGDGGPAINANLNYPNGVAVDAFGDIFISDAGNNRIRMVDGSGNISTVAGNGGTSYSGDGGYATNAGIYNPSGICLDTSGNLYIGGLSAVRKVGFNRIPTLTLTNISAANAGNYSVVVTSASGSVTSSVAALNIFLPPSISQPPKSTRVPAGYATNLSVTASNYPPFGYQWFTSSGRTATAVPSTVIGGHITSVSMIDAGMGYVTPPNVHFIGGSGSGATATAIVMFGSVLQINIQNSGSGYTASLPAIQIDPPPVINSALTGQTNSTLSFSPAALADMTNYFVVVTNNYGSATSATVFLTVFLPPQNFSAQNLGTNLLLQLNGSPDYPYTLQTATNLAPPVNWQNEATIYADTNGNWQFADTNVNAAQKYYRALGQ